LNSDVEDDGIDRLDGEDEKPFQSFASQMQHYGKNGKTHADYTKLNADGNSQDANR